MDYCKKMYTLETIYKVADFLVKENIIEIAEDYVEFLKVGENERKKAYTKQVQDYRNLEQQ